MNEAVFEYKCRRCAQITANTVTGEVYGDDCLRAAIANNPTLLPIPMRADRPRATSLHSCADGGRGITDLIGYSAKGNND